MRNYKTDGCFNQKGLLSNGELEPIKNAVLDNIRQFIDVTSIQDPKWVAYANENASDVTTVYDRLRDHPTVHELGRNKKITDIVNSILDKPALYEKVPLRIDVPFENKELAFWHQDDFYVQGNTSELTIWIPLQDTRAHNGALSTMKGSHKGGPIPHTLKVGKKTLPEGIFDNPIHISEMNEGDCLFFSSYLVHQSNLNISENIRYSIQLRYTSRTAGQCSNVMGRLINV